MNERLENEINPLIQEITALTDYLYQQKLTEGYKKLDGLLEHIMTVVDKLFLYKASATIDFNEQSFLGSLTAAMKAIEDKDSVMLADILTFEIIEQLKVIITRDEA